MHADVLGPAHKRGAALAAAGPQRAGRQAAALGLACFALYASVFLIKSAMLAAQWRGERALGLELKSALAAAQTLGYLMGKAPALAIAPKLEQRELLPASLAIIWLAGALVCASTALPPTLGVIAVSLACVILSPTWYVMQRSIEGRAHTEAIMAVASLSVIGMSGVAKAMGAQLLRQGASERGMVAVCALAGVLLGSLAAVGVGMQPPPSAADVRLRGNRSRVVSLRRECALLMSRYGRGIALSTAAFVLCGTVRAFRDFFQAELLGAVGQSHSPSAFAGSELLISVLVLAVTSGFSRVRDNLTALRAITATAALGGLLIAAMSALWLGGRIGGYSWIVGTGAGTFLCYVPMGGMLYDRLLSAGGEQVTATPLTLAGDTAVLLATALLLASRSGTARESAGEAGDATAPLDAAQANAATAHFFAWLSLFGGLAIALLAGAGGLAFVAAVRVQRKQLRIRQQRSDGPSGEEEGEDGSDDRALAAAEAAGGGRVLRGGPSGELTSLTSHLRANGDHGAGGRRASETEDVDHRRTSAGWS